MVASLSRRRRKKIPLHRRAPFALTGMPKGKTRQPFGSCRRCGANWWLSCARVVAIRTRIKLQLDVIQLWREVMVGIDRWRGRSTAGSSLAGARPDHCGQTVLEVTRDHSLCANFDSYEALS
jgi:hypothetical protein